MSLIRYILAIFGIVSVVVFPAWVPLLCMGVLALLFRSWEVIVIGLVADLLWMPGGITNGIPFFTMVGLVLAWGLEPLRNELSPFSR